MKHSEIVISSFLTWQSVPGSLVLGDCTRCVQLQTGFSQTVPANKPGVNMVGASYTVIHTLMQAAMILRQYHQWCQ